MKMPTFNKKRDLVLCLMCKINYVQQKDWQRPCDSCRNKADNIEQTKSVVVGRRMPAAVIDSNGRKIFVDKLGNEVKDHGYDLTNDPRGWKRNGYLPNSKKDIII